MQQPSFSVIVGCYNHNAFIRETVRSVLSQTYSPLQVIVVDDASTDLSLDVLKEFGAGITLVALSKNGGGSAARNAGASHATGDYLVFLDGDDALAPWALEVYATLASIKHPEIMLASMFTFTGPTVRTGNVYWNGTQILDYNGRAEKIVFVDYGTLANKDRKFSPSGSSIIVERTSFWNAGGWQANIFPGEDLDILLSMLYKKPAIYILSPPTAYYRRHSDNTTRRIGFNVRGIRMVIRKAKAGAYADARGRKLQGYSFLGGGIWYWVRRAMEFGKYGLAAGLLIDGFPMIVTAIFARVATRVFGQRKADVIPSLASSANGSGDHRAG